MPRLCIIRLKEVAQSRYRSMPNPKIVVDAFGTLALTASHPEVKKLKRLDQIPSIHGNKVWGSSFMIMDYLLENPIPENEKVVDVGCG